MTATDPVATAEDETPVYLRAGDDHVFGILTQPRVPNGAAVLFLHAGLNFTAHRNGHWTRLARECADHGFLSFRMDYHGSGDSPGVLHDRGFGGQTAADLDAVVAWLVDQGARQVVPVGTCWGGLVGLTTAARSDVIPMVCLISSPLEILERTHGDLKKARGKETPATAAIAGFFSWPALKLLLKDRSYRRWVVYRVRRRLVRRKEPSTGAAVLGAAHDTKLPAASLIYPELDGRGVQVRAIFGEPEPYYQHLIAPGATPELDSRPDTFEIVVTPTRIHGFTTLKAQEIVREQVLTWLRPLEG